MRTSLPPPLCVSVCPIPGRCDRHRPSGRGVGASRAAGAQMRARPVCTVCLSEELHEDDSGAFVCAECGTQLASFIAEQNEADADVAGARYKRRQSLVPPAGGTPRVVGVGGSIVGGGDPADTGARAEPDADESGVPRAELTFEDKAAAVQAILELQAPAVAELAGVPTLALHRSVGALWFKYLDVVGRALERADASDSSSSGSSERSGAAGAPRPDADADADADADVSTADEADACAHGALDTQLSLIHI